MHKSNLEVKTLAGIKTNINSEYDNNIISDNLDVNFEKSGGKIPPHSNEAETSILGAILLDNEVIHGIIEIIRPEDFYDGSHQIIFESMIELIDRRDPVDIVTLSSELKSKNLYDRVGGLQYLNYLIDVVPTSANTQFYSRVIKEMSLRRKLIHEIGEISTEALSGEGDIDSFLDSVEKRIFDISESKIKKGLIKAADVVKDSVKHIEKLYINKEPITGLSSGFKDLDHLTSGLQKSDLVIIAGRPSMGKTALVLSIAQNVTLNQDKTCAFFSLEMSREQIVMRLLCAESRVSNSRIRSGNLAENDLPKIVEAASRISQSKLYIDDTPALSVLEMRAKARRLHRETPLDLIIVDYLQLMKAPSRRIERRDQEISEISSSLKALAKELNIPVIALSQLNRSVETRNDKRPIMADLRESGAIEQDADIIGFVYRDEVYNPETPDKGVAELIISKHRNGSIGTIRMAFMAELTRFEDLAEEEVTEYDYLGDDLSINFDEDDEPLI